MYMMEPRGEVPQAGVGRRLAALIVDMLLVYLMYGIVLLSMGGNPLTYSFKIAFPYPLLYGILLFLYSFILDLLVNSTPGKILFSLNLSPPESERVLWIFLREAFKINVYVLLLDLILGVVLSSGRVLRLTDLLFQGGVVERAARSEPLYQPPPRPVYRPPTPPPKKPVEKAPPEQAAYEGRCPRCGMPYALTEDGREISGLWNGMCIWCGYPVLRYRGG